MVCSQAPRAQIRGKHIWDILYKKSWNTLCCLVYPVASIRNDAIHDKQPSRRGRSITEVPKNNTGLLVRPVMNNCFEEEHSCIANRLGLEEAVPYK